MNSKSLRLNFENVWILQIDSLIGIRKIEGSKTLHTRPLWWNLSAAAGVEKN